jgi:hypothetical protein
MWFIPVVVLLGSLALNEKHMSDVIGLVIGLGILAFFVQRPGPALITLIIFLPLEQVGLGLLHRLGVPGTILRPASSFKELLGICILISALRQIRDSRERLDKIDIAILAYVGVCLAYLAVPHLFSSIAPTAWNPRLLAWRSDCGYPLVFFGVRHAPIDPKYKRHFITAVLWIAGLTTLGGVYQYIDPGSWSHWILVTAGQINYQFYVLGETAFQVSQNLKFVFQTSPLHVASIFFSPYDMGDYLIIVIAICGETIGLLRRFGRHHRHSADCTPHAAPSSRGALADRRRHPCRRRRHRPLARRHPIRRGTGWVRLGHRSHPRDRRRDQIHLEAAARTGARRPAGHGGPLRGADRVPR